jgi:hypothetical protein
MLATKGVTDAGPKATRDLGGAIQSSLRNHKGANVVTVRAMDSCGLALVPHVDETLHFPPPTFVGFSFCRE